MAYITKGKGGYRAQIQRSGVRRSKTFPTKAAAAAWASREEAAILAGESGMYPARTLREALDRYVRDVSSTKGSGDKERLRCDALIRDFPSLADKVFHTITSSDLAAWRDARLRVVSSGAVRRDATLFRHVWTIARKEWRWCGSNPWSDIKFPEDNPPRVRLLGWREVRALCRRLNYVTGAAPLSASEATAWALLVALRTGMRAGELMGLTVDTVDLDARVATLKQHKTFHVTRRARGVPLTAHGVRLLGKLMQAARADGRDRLFPVAPSSLDTLFRKARDRLMIPDVHFHDSRATALTHLARRVDVMTLARVSGHRDLKQLLTTYYRETDAAIAARLGRLATPSRHPRSTSDFAG